MGLKEREEGGGGRGRGKVDEREGGRRGKRGIPFSLKLSNTTCTTHQLASGRIEGRHREGREGEERDLQGYLIHTHNTTCTTHTSTPTHPHTHTHTHTHTHPHTSVMKKVEGKGYFGRVEPCMFLR